MPTISIIVPIYNKEKYISRCVASLLNQTLKDLQIILVDDGSTDKSKKICDEYLKIDNRIEVIHKENGGVSAARNYGLEIAKGDYITFVDPDDYLDLDAIEYLYNLIDEYNADIACYRMRTYKNNMKKNNDENDENIEIYTGNKIIENQILGKFLYSSCNKLYSRDLFNNVNDRFNENIMYAEDALFNIYMMSKSNKLVFSNSKKYNYFINEESTVSKINDKRLDILKAQKIMFYFLRKNNYSYSQYISMQYIDSIILLVNEIAYNKVNSKNNYILKELKKIINRDKEIWSGLNKSSVLTRIKFNIIRFYPVILVVLYRVKYNFKSITRS